MKTEKSPRILIIDDEEDICFLLSTLLKANGYSCHKTAKEAEAISLIRNNKVDLALLDYSLPNKTGLEILREIRTFNRNFPVILATGWGTPAIASEAGRLHVNGFLTKPFKNDEVVLTVQMALAEYDRKRNAGAGLPEENGMAIGELFGPSTQIQNVLKDIKIVAPTQFTVIITGETGVGKELVAHAIHRLSYNCEGPFVPVDCGSIPESLMESKLFGHEKGAFTGADRQQIGCFEAAEGGTLFLDEIGNLPLLMQAKLLRVLEAKEITRIGSNTSVPVNTRVLVATNESLVTKAKGGQFRKDLFFRLNEFSIDIPPLRDRPEDLLFLASRFISSTNEELNKTIEGMTNSAVQLITQSPWPGNVRELRNIMRRAVLEADTQIDSKNLEHAGLPHLEPDHPIPPNEDKVALFSLKFETKKAVQDSECEIIRKVLVQTKGNLKAAARILQIDYKTMRTKAQAYNLYPPK